MTVKEVLTVSSGSVVIIENYDDNTGDMKIIAESDYDGSFDSTALDMVSECEVLSIYPSWKDDISTLHIEI